MISYNIEDREIYWADVRYFKFDKFRIVHFRRNHLNYNFLFRKQRTNDLKKIGFELIFRYK